MIHYDDLPMIIRILFIPEIRKAKRRWEKSGLLLVVLYSSLNFSSCQNFDVARVDV